MSAPSCDASALLGSWINAEHASESVARLDISRRSDGYFVSTFGGGSTARRPWGEVTSTPCAMTPDSRVAGAMVAVHDFGFLETTLTFFLKSGIVILDTFNDFKEGSGRAAHFTREFFYRRKVEAPDPSPARGSAAVREDLAAAMRSPGPHRVDPATIVGTWRSCDAATPGLVELILGGGDDELNLRAFSPGAPESSAWGSTPCVAYAATALGGPAIACKALYQHPSRRVLLAAYLNKGLLAVDSFHLFEEDSGRSSYRARDHFFRVQGTTS